MKKALIFAMVLALLWPASVFAAAQFSLGGFVKLNSFWDSTQQSSHLSSPVLRDNEPNFNHGRLQFTSQESRFNFTIKGPNIFGAILTGFIEMDFDQTQDNGNITTSNSWSPRLRHAMFRLNWPETELLFGQYWSIFCSWYIEAAEAGPFQVVGTPTARLPQIRLTQKFLSDWEVAGMLGLPNNATLTSNTPYSGTGSNGTSAETPQVQATIKYAHDWWGKAAYYGKPIPFTAQVTAGWQRSISRLARNFGLETFGNDDFVNLAAHNQIDQKFVSPWIVMGTLFIPVIPTHTPNLAGTAALLAQWWVGQGVEAFGFTGTGSNLYRYQFTAGGVNFYDVSLLKRFGGFVSGQYYFTNQWFLNVAYGISRAYGVDTSNANILAQDALHADQMKTMQQVDTTLWYRPIQALKFGLQYSYAQTKWFQKVTEGSNVSDLGHEHRVEFVGFFFF